MEVRRWIEGDESAAEMLARVSTERPFLLLPPLHRLPLRVGNVVELVGPSPSAKTLILTQAAISCILPKEWNGVHYGGLGRMVVFIDLDCRFDILRLSNLLKHRIMEPSGSLVGTTVERDDVDNRRKSHVAYDDELFALCMRRFLYVRCYDSFEFLATLKNKVDKGGWASLLAITAPVVHCNESRFKFLCLKEKTLHYQLKQVEAVQQSSVYLLMIDSIGAFHWVERASTFSQSRSTNRKSLSLQSVSETVVQEMRKLLLVHPMLVIAAKVISLVDRYSTNEVQRKKSFSDTQDFRSVTSTHKLPYREYMPSVWQSFVTHRILVRASDDDPTVRDHQICPVYLSEWLLPPLSVLDKFIVKDGFIFIVS